jgi:hypothetical protein
MDSVLFPNIFKRKMFVAVQDEKNEQKQDKFNMFHIVAWNQYILLWGVYNADLVMLVNY